MADTEIEWCDVVWNCVRGCARVSRGCGDGTGGGCYAERQAIRFAGRGGPYEGLVRMTKGGPRWTGDVRFVPEKLGEPLRWRKPRRVFVNSMSDLFHEKLSNELIAAVFGIMAAAARHTFQCLTKRPARMLEWFRWIAQQTPSPSVHAAWCALRAEADAIGDNGPLHCKYGPAPEAEWPLPNVWLGVSAEDQATADERIPLLLDCHAAVRWVSLEPQIAAVDLGRWMHPDRVCGCGGLCDSGMRCPMWQCARRLQWIVQGGESGPGAREFRIEWARSVRDQCAAASVPWFFKQAGSIPTENGRRLHLRDRKGGDFGELPSDLQIREWPRDGAS